MNDEEELEPDVVQEKTVHIPFPDSFTYVNCAAFAISQMEIRIGFAEAMHTGQAFSRGGIVLPPEAAAVIALILLQQVKTYEKNFGEIRHPLWRALKSQAEAVPDLPPLGPEKAV